MLPWSDSRKLFKAQKGGVGGGAIRGEDVSDFGEDYPHAAPACQTAGNSPEAIDAPDSRVPALLKERKYYFKGTRRDRQQPHAGSLPLRHHHPNI